MAEICDSICKNIEVEVCDAIATYIRSVVSTIQTTTYQKKRKTPRKKRRTKKSNKAPKNEAKPERHEWTATLSKYTPLGLPYTMGFMCLNYYVESLATEHGREWVIDQFKSGTVSQEVVVFIHAARHGVATMAQFGTILQRTAGWAVAHSSQHHFESNITARTIAMSSLMEMRFGTGTMVKSSILNIVISDLLMTRLGVVGIGASGVVFQWDAMYKMYLGDPSVLAGTVLMYSNIKDDLDACLYDGCYRVVCGQNIGSGVHLVGAFVGWGVAMLAQPHRSTTMEHFASHVFNWCKVAAHSVHSHCGTLQKPSLVIDQLVDSWSRLKGNAGVVTHWLSGHNAPTGSSQKSPTGSSQKSPTIKKKRKTIDNTATQHYHAKKRRHTEISCNVSKRKTRSASNPGTLQPPAY